MYMSLLNRITRLKLSLEHCVNALKKDSHASLKTASQVVDAQLYTTISELEPKKVTF
jgi:hypothetical protein